MILMPCSTTVQGVMSTKDRGFCCHFSAIGRPASQPSYSVRKCSNILLRLSIVLCSHASGRNILFGTRTDQERITETRMHSNEFNDYAVDDGSENDKEDDDDDNGDDDDATCFVLCALLWPHAPAVGRLARVRSSSFLVSF